MNTIDSVIKQNFKEWEMIIIDDGSIDNTKKILEKYLIIDKRIKPYFTPGIGRGEALNKAIELASSDYITNVDADDVIHPQKLDIQMNVFKRNKNLFLVSTRGINFFNNDRVSWKDITNKHYNFEVIKDKLLVRNIINHSSVMMNKALLIDIGKYNIYRKSQLDYELWLRAYCKNMKMIELQEELTAKRIHHNQSFENKKRFKYLVSASLLQIRYNLKMKKNYHLILMFPFRVTLGLLPFNFRQMIRRVLRIT